MMKKGIIYGLIILFFMDSCMDPAGKNRPKESIKLSNKEKKFIKELYKRGYKEIKIVVPAESSVPLGKNVYQINIGIDSSLNSSNINYFIDLKKEIAKELYNSVIEEDVIKNINSILVIFNFNKKEINPFQNQDWVEFIQKDSLEEWGHDPNGAF